jgi:myo-inositol-1(or 4)-monophosphatase
VTAEGGLRDTLERRDTLSALDGPSIWTAELAFARDVARSAGEILMERYERLEQIDYKSARDVVTEADHLSEAHVIAAIRERFPGDAILAEESGAHAATDSQPVNGRTWVIDPLDGTINYANGLPVFCVAIGFVVDGRSKAGVILDPTRGETFAATADGPATLNGRLIRTSTKDKMSDHVISLALSGRAVANRARAIRKEIRIARSMGSAALALAYVGNGRFDAMIQETGLSPWDVAAAGLIAERGGATVTAFDGSAWNNPARGPKTVGVVAAPPSSHARILALVNGR